MDHLLALLRLRIDVRFSLDGDILAITAGPFGSPMHYYKTKAVDLAACRRADVPWFEIAEDQLRQIMREYDAGGGPRSFLDHLPARGPRLDLAGEPMIDARDQEQTRSQPEPTLLPAHWIKAANGSFVGGDPPNPPARRSRPLIDEGGQQ